MNDERRSTLFEQIVDHHEKEQNSLRECREIVGRLVEWGKKYPKGTIHSFKAEKEHDAIESDAARLWAKMQQEAEDA